MQGKSEHTDVRLEQPLAQLFDQYEAQRKLGPESRTLDDYRKAWIGVVDYLRRSKGQEPVVADLTTKSLTCYLTTVGDERGWGEQSRRTYGGNIRSVVSGLRKKLLVPADCLATFETPAVTDRPPVFFDDLTLALIFDALEADRTTGNLRLRIAANIMLDCGARPAEVSALTFADLWEGSSQVRIHGKGAKDRVVPVGVHTWQYVADYMRARGRPTAPTESILLDLRGARRRAASTTLASDMNDLLIRLGLVVRGSRVEGIRDASGYSLYTMRRTFARRAAEGGMDVAELAAMMGHEPSSIPMLMRLYYRPTELHKQRAHAEARPADGLHDWRPTRGAESPSKGGRALTFFERWAGPSRSADAGKRLFRDPPLRSRMSGEYRSTSRTSSAAATGA